MYQWYSTNPAVATVDRNGIVTAQKPGKTTIVADTYTTTLRCDVTVVSNVGRVTLNQGAAVSGEHRRHGGPESFRSRGER